MEIIKSVFWLFMIAIVLFDGEIADLLEAKAEKIRAEAERIRNDNRTDSVDDKQL